MSKAKIIKRSQMGRIDMDHKIIDDRHVILRKVCHGNPRKSFWFRDRPFPICARCTLFYPTILPGILVGMGLIKFMDPSSLGMLALSVGLISPLVVDGLTQYYGKRSSNNALRAVTGAMGGLGAGIALIYIISRIIDIIQ